jgi:hypothetical protein
VEETPGIETRESETILIEGGDGVAVKRGENSS